MFLILFKINVIGSPVDANRQKHCPWYAASKTLVKLLLKFESDRKREALLRCPVSAMLP